ncbi:MAG: RNA recognition motif domain-containing protein [Luteibaculaceae bacterium]
MKLFVANLDRSLTAENVEEIFQIYGTVSSAKLIFDKDSGISKGYGFVEMENDHEAQDAIENLHDSQVKERTITVKAALPPDVYKSNVKNNDKSKTRDI